MLQILFGGATVVLLFYLFTFWTLRRLAKVSRLKYLIRKGVISANEPFSLAYKNRPIILAFFHPYCNAGGGGEQVLWTAVLAIQSRFTPDQVRCLVYTGDLDANPQQILQTVRHRFNIDLPYDVDFVYLKQRYLVEDKRYPRFTLLLQSLGSVVLGLEAMSYVAPDIFFDTMGYAFTYPFFSWMVSAKVIAYVHYPTISSDMLQVVESRAETFNNRSGVARSELFSQLKYHYYTYFAALYGVMGRRVSSIMVNSTWTRNHIDDIWEVPNRTRIIYPPCDSSELSNMPFQPRENIIVSIAQFRPEKNHHLQLISFSTFLRQTRSPFKHQFKLVLIGGARNEEDMDRVRELKDLASELGVESKVEFHVNAPFETVKRYLGRSKIGLHTMTNEHFGISIVNYMAAGCIVLAHKSGGPLSDIVVPWNGQQTGYLADNEAEYVEKMESIMALSESQSLQIQQAARDTVHHRFSETIFIKQLMDCVEPWIEKTQEVIKRS